MRRLPPQSLNVNFGYESEVYFLRSLAHAWREKRGGGATPLLRKLEVKADYCVKMLSAGT